MAWTRQASRSVTSIFLSFRSFSSSECATKSITPIYISSPTLITPPFNLKGLQEPPSNIIYPLGWPSIDFFRDEVNSPGIEDSSAPMQCRWKSIPTNRVRKNRHGFLARIKTKGGRKILKRRLLKGRYRLTW